MANRPVVCVETGRVFESISQAANFMGAYQSNISAALRGESVTACGYHWEYVGSEKKEKLTARPRSAPSMTIEEVQAEAERRTRETGRYTRYAHIQVEETLALARNQVIVHRPKRRAKR